MSPQQREIEPLNVVIVGCGLGGLSCAIQCLRQQCKVTILERAPELQPIGAGIVVPPNATRVLGHYGLVDSLLQKGAVPITGARFLSFDDGKVLYGRRNRLSPAAQKLSLDPACVTHRADYHETLHEEAIRLGCTVRLGCEMQDVDFEAPAVILSDGSVIAADVVVGADGLWSTFREKVLGKPAPPQPTGDLAYRMTLSGDDMAAIDDPDVQELLKPNMSTVWLGPDRHCVMYPIRKRTMWNLVLMGPDNIPEGIRTQAATLEEMRNCFDGWEPRLQKILSQGKSAISWKLLHADELDIWSKGSCVLLGDACHPSLPYQAQGAAMALEDGITLGVLLGSLNELVESSATQHQSITQRNHYVPELLLLFEALRKPRTTLNQKGSQSNQYWYQASTPEDRERRNKVMLAATGEGECEWKGADLNYQKQLLGFDAKKNATDAFDKWRRKTLSPI